MSECEREKTKPADGLTVKELSSVLEVQRLLVHAEVKTSGITSSQTQLPQLS